MDATRMVRSASARTTLALVATRSDGPGDAFVALLCFANAAGALATETLGVIPALPTRAAVEARATRNG